MRLPRAMPLDLAECVLEDRVLMAYGPGLQGNAFFSYNPYSNAIVVPNSGSGSGPGGGSTNPGPSFYNLLVGLSLSSTGALGPGSGGTISLYSLNIVPSTSLGTGNSLLSGRTGNSSTGGGGGSTGPRASGANGYGSQFSSGFNFAIGLTNNFGMTPITLGSVPVHTYGGGGDPVAEPTNPANQPDNNATPNPLQPPAEAPMSGPINTMSRGVDVNPRNNLLGRNPAGSDVSPSRGPGR